MRESNDKKEKEIKKGENEKEEENPKEKETRYDVNNELNKAEEER